MCAWFVTTQQQQQQQREAPQHGEEFKCVWCVRVCVRESRRESVCTCVCVCVRDVCACVCVMCECVCAWCACGVVRVCATHVGCVRKLSAWLGGLMLFTVAAVAAAHLQVAAGAEAQQQLLQPAALEPCE